MNYQKLITRIFLALTTGLLLQVNADAQTCPSGDPLVISTSCTYLNITSNKSAVTIDAGNSVANVYPPTGSNAPAITIDSGAAIQQFNNNGSIVGYRSDNSGLLVNSSNSTIVEFNNNAGARITSAAVNTNSTYEGAIRNEGVITTLNNKGSIYASSGAGVLAYGVVVGGNGVIGTLNNAASGSISGQLSGIIVSGTIGTLNNAGSITGGAANNAISKDAIWVTSAGSIGVINNTGSIYSTNGADINNAGVITTLNNAQMSLLISGNLPTNYNVIVRSAANYGVMFASPGSLTSGTQTNFGIASGSTITTNSYAGVLAGMTASNLKNTTGTYQGLTWKLTPTDSTHFDLSFSGTNTAVNAVNNITATGLQTAFALQNTVLVNGFTYDCPLFDKNNVCVSAGGRYTAVDAQSVNSGAAVLIGAYRWNDQVRLGAYIDQNVSTNTTGIIKVSNASPMVGLFGVWSERLDGTGAEVKVSAGYGQKNTTMTRPVIDGTEPGSGSSTLTSQGAQAIGKYGFAVTDNTILSPYAGLRYTQNNMNGYTENASASVTAPLTYAPLNTNATTVVAGLGATYKVIPAVTLLASAGVEADTNTQYSSYTATGLYGLTPISMNPNPKYTRPTGMLGAYYDVEKNQRISLTGVYRQAPYQGVGATTYMALYTIGL